MLFLFPPKPEVTMIPKIRILALASLLLVVLGISKLGHEEIDLDGVGIEKLDTIPPPPPPVDVILDKPTIIGFLPDSLRLDSLFETNVFLEGTPLENYEVDLDSIEIDPSVYAEISGAGVVGYVDGQLVHLWQGC